MPAGHIKGIWLTLGANAIKRRNSPRDYRFSGMGYNLGGVNFFPLFFYRGVKISNFFIFGRRVLKTSSRGLSDMGNTMVTSKTFFVPPFNYYRGVKIGFFLFCVVER